MTDERLKKEANDDIEVKLNHILCRDQAFINDKKFKYVLVTNKVCEDQNCCGMTDSSDLDWVKSMEWQAVFDFDPNTLKDGLACRILENKDVLQKPQMISGNT